MTRSSCSIQPSHRILVVHDEPDVTALVAYHLAKAGYRVSTAANDREALRTAREDRPNLIIVGLTDRSGFDIVTQLRRREDTRDLGIVVLISGRRVGPHSRPGARRRRLPPQTLRAARAGAARRGDP